MTGGNLVLEIERHGPVVVLVFNRPHALNAIDKTLAAAFRSACESISGDPEVGTVVMRGAGPAFVAGGDLGVLAREPESVTEHLIDPMHEGLSLLLERNVPLIAGVHGSAAGAGMSLVMACDLAYAARGTRFNLAYLRIGASCDLGASWTLPRLVGPRRAMELALLNRTVDEDEALSLGLVNGIVEPDGLAAYTLDIARRIAGAPRRAVEHMVRLLRGSAQRTFTEHLRAERDAFHDLATGEGFAQHVEAFLASKARRG